MNPSFPMEARCFSVCTSVVGVLFLKIASAVSAIKGCINDSTDIFESFHQLSRSILCWQYPKLEKGGTKHPHCWLLCLIIKVSSSRLKQFLISVVAVQQLLLLWARPPNTPLCYCVSYKNPSQSLIRLTLSWPPFLLSYSSLTKEQAKLWYVAQFKVVF